ncbi:MAG: divalent-cation tolerance protein CutA [Nanoarchaeota archaeon]
MVLIYITCKDIIQAKNISMHLLEKRLIACSNMFPIESMYWWKGKIEEESEIVLLAKSKDRNFEEIVRQVTKIHSYDVPAIIKIDTESSKDYQDWINKEVD